MPRWLKMTPPGRAKDRECERRNMETKLIERMNKAIKRIGGPLAVLELPKDVRDAIANCEDYETRVIMLEFVADRLGK